MGNQGILRSKTFDFAILIIDVYKKLVTDQREYVMSRQLLKAGTAPGALIREAEYGQSKPDFISKLSIALKEANECEYWLSLLKHSNYISEEIFQTLETKNKEIIFMLISSINTAKSNLKSQ